ncbi:hypothetical protein PS3A_03520 [Pseudomonas sp. 3A(2025)]
MAKSVGDLRRKPARFKVQPTVLIVCEDKVSSKEYFLDAAKWYRSNAKVEVAHIGATDPKNIVLHAIKNKRNYDEIYCAIDRDKHETFDEAISLAQPHKNVTVIASYPCFEIWFLIHFGVCRKPYMEQGKRSAGDCLLVDLRTKAGMADYDKGRTKGVFERLYGAPLELARQAAEKMLADAEKCGELNPSTRVHILLNEIERLGKPQNLARS